MNRLFSNIKIEVNKNLYLKDPQSTDLGKKIIENSILLINNLGFEHFTFKKLGVEIGSTESSIYRYFENKHKLLLYLTSWYWGWKEYQLVFGTNNISNPEEKLLSAIEILTKQVEEDSSNSHINEVILNEVVVNEYSKSYIKIEVDKEIKEGLFATYNRLILRLKEMILEVNSSYKFPASLASTILEGALQQYFLKEHFPVFSKSFENNTPTEFFQHLVISTLKNNNGNE